MRLLSACIGASKDLPVRTRRGFVKNDARLIGGTIEMKREPGKTTSFTVAVPLGG